MKNYHGHVQGLKQTRIKSQKLSRLTGLDMSYRASPPTKPLYIASSPNMSDNQTSIYSIIPKHVRQPKHHIQHHLQTCPTTKPPYAASPPNMFDN
ncbi:hypothetical protein PoB_003209500 [Plakobranchus ocellatus]|uniref:Uncharacterized protein n=1 Tax=Plakobranchus ocellatus TaxID=259542 RepID=A0AAV4ABQ4_9GAST|nr:hypothetical protein PoB_003209500 [Plakobranchus ocellatus]